MHGHHGWGGWGHHWGGGGGWGLGWIFPAILLGQLFSGNAPRPQGWPYSTPPAPQPPQPPQPLQTPAHAANAEPKSGMQCSNCDHAFSADFKFCPHCGTRVAPRTCRYCGQQLDKQMAYCPHCGGPAK